MQDQLFATAAVAATDLARITAIGSAVAARAALVYGTAVGVSAVLTV
jgi:hypothetical protein